MPVSKADPDLGARLDKLQDAANTASGHARNVYVPFLLFGLYLAIIFGATTHEQLLRQSPVTLPLLGVGLPLFGFFWIAPALFVLLHLNLLLQLYLLSGNLHRFDRVLRRAVSRGLLDRERANERRAQLYPFPFSQMLVGRQHGRSMRFLLWLMVWLTVLVLPIVILLMGQAQFLPYHHAWTTMWQRLMVLADVVLILIFWRAIRHPGDRLLWHPGRWVWHQAKVLSLGVVALALSFIVFTFPGGDGGDFGDPMADLVARQGWLARPSQMAFETFPFLQRNLVVTEANLVARWPTQSQINQLGEDLAWQNFGGPLSLRGRDLRYASLSNSILVRADLRSSDLEGSDLVATNLRGASLVQAKLSGASLSGADLRNSNLTGAQLRGVVGVLVNLQEAQLQQADLQKALLRKSLLEGADLAGANLQGARFEGSNLLSANLASSDLRGALFDGAEIDGANLTVAKLQGGLFRRASLQGADLTGANLQAADLRLADLRGAKFGVMTTSWPLRFGCQDEECPNKGGYLQEFLQLLNEPAKLEGVDLRGANVEGANFVDVNLWRVLPDQEEDLGHRWRLTDLRGADVEPINNLESLIEGSISDIADQETSETVANRLRVALRGADRPGIPAFPKAWKVAASAMFDLSEPIPQKLGWGPSAWTTFEDYDDSLVVFLAGLACAKQANIHIAQGLAQRALLYDYRRYAQKFVGRMTAGDCATADELADHTREELEALAASR